MDLLSEHGYRQDGRKPDQIRNINCRLGVYSQADGSAYLEQGNTKVPFCEMDCALCHVSTFRYWLLCTDLTKRSSAVVYSRISALSTVNTVWQLSVPPSERYISYEAKNYMHITYPKIDFTELNYNVGIFLAVSAAR